MLISTLNYNQPDLTDNLVNQLKRDTSFSQHELMVVDNGSTRELAKSTTHKLPENLFFGGGLNVIMDYFLSTKHEYFVLFNNDLIFHGPRLLTNMIKEMEDNDLSLFTVLYWVGNDNYLLASSSGKINKPIDLSSRKYLDYSNKNFGKIIFSSPIIGVVSNENILPISLTLTSEKGYVVGTSVLSVQIKELLTKLSQFKTPNEEFMILSQNNILLSSYEDFQKIINQDKLSFSATKWQIIFSFFSNKNKEFLLFEEKSEDFSIVIAVKRQYFVDEMKNIMLPYLVQAINIILLLFFLR